MALFRLDKSLSCSPAPASAAAVRGWTDIEPWAPGRQAWPRKLIRWINARRSGPGRSREPDRRPRGLGCDGSSAASRRPSRASTGATTDPPRRYGARRVTEMSEAAATLESLGLQPIRQPRSRRRSARPTPSSPKPSTVPTRRHQGPAACSLLTPDEVAAPPRSGHRPGAVPGPACLKLLEQDFYVHEPTPEAFEQEIVDFPADTRPAQRSQHRATRPVATWLEDR